MLALEIRSGIIRFNSMPTKAYFGEVLKTKVTETRPERLAMIEGLLYEKSVIMISADPGVGKSVLIANIMASLSTGLSAFGSLFIPKPRICYYIPFERGEEEIFERLNSIHTSIPITWENIYVNPSFIGMNVIHPPHADEIIAMIKSDCKPDLIILDPIYASVAGGLSTDDKASQFCRFSARLQSEFKCSIWLNHHTVKDTYSSFDGQKIGKQDPFYGSQWLKAHVTGSYHMSSRDDGVILEKKKDNLGNLIEKLTLGFNPEDFTQYAKDYDEESTSDIKIKDFLRKQFNLKRRFTFAELKGCVRGVSTSYLRKKFTQPAYIGYIKKHKSIGHATLYEITELF